MHAICISQNLLRGHDNIEEAYGIVARSQLWRLGQCEPGLLYIIRAVLGMVITLSSPSTEVGMSITLAPIEAATSRAAFADNTALKIQCS